MRVPEQEASTTVGSAAEAAAVGWHPDIGAIYAYWDAIRPAPERLPARRHLDPAAIVRLLPDIWMLDVHRDPFRMRYRLVGTAVVAAHGRELTGQWFDEAHPNLGPEYYKRYQDVVETHRPSWRRGPPFLDQRSRMLRIVENIVLPLAEDGATVDILLCLTRIYGDTGEVRF
mgnify:CR=1 FL=1